MLTFFFKNLITLAYLWLLTSRTEQIWMNKYCILFQNKIFFLMLGSESNFSLCVGWLIYNIVFVVSHNQMGSKKKNFKYVKSDTKIIVFVTHNVNMTECACVWLLIIEASVLSDRLEQLFFLDELKAILTAIVNRCRAFQISVR